jgi:exopolysaccharide biosynthesis polyprenyl glycosylphosphotransferase
MQPIWERSQKKKLLLADAILFTSLVVIAFLLRTENPPSLLWTSPGFYLVITLNMICLYVFGTYDFEEEFSRAALLTRILSAVGAATLVILFFNFILEKRREGIFGRGVLLGAELAFIVFASATRLFIAGSLMRARTKSKWLILAGRDWFFHMNKDLESKFSTGQFTVKAPIEANEALKGHWTGIVLATKVNELAKDQSELLLRERFQGKNISGVVRFYERVFKKIPLFALNDVELIHSEGFLLFQSPIVLRVKRLADIFLALILSVITAPLMLLAAIAIKLESKGPAIYTQVRTGKEGRNFTIFKFRSMRLDAEKAGVQWAQKNDPRVTLVGRFIRATRIDELPQLLNVLRGDMSFVGPRPERPEFNEELDKQIPFYHLRHFVRPGLTGWAQVMYPYGSNLEDATQKVQFDLFYIKNHNLLLDALIVLRTIRVVLFGHGR